MITITIPKQDKKEFWDPIKEEFILKKEIPETTITLEHSLVSISKWESKWKKAFLKECEKTPEEVFDYIKCMTIESDIPDEVYENIPVDEMTKIKEYIEDKMSATCIQNKQESGQKKSKDVITSELIYYWMVANQIPFECQNWHLNRLLTLIQICSVKNAAMYSGKKSKSDMASLLKRNAALNAARRSKLGSKG